MGILAIVDTFLIYKIVEYRYDRRVAFIASVLFAVTPLNWMIRWILLDSIQLPLLLSSILFAIYHDRNKNTDLKNKGNNARKNILVILISGIFLGLTIFTKVPAFIMIPVVGYLIYTNNKNFKSLGLWLIPVISIPMIWPAYAISVDEFDKWIGGILWQVTERVEKPLSDTMIVFFKLDPILFILSWASLVYAVVKKDVLVILWAIPFLIFLYLIGYVSLFHIIPILPVFCIAASRFILYLSDKIIAYVVSGNNKTIAQRILPFVITFAIGIFGLIVTSFLVTMNLTPTFFEVTAFSFSLCS